MGNFQYIIIYSKNCLRQKLKKFVFRYFQENMSGKIMQLKNCGRRQILNIAMYGFETVAAKAKTPSPI